MDKIETKIRDTVKGLFSEGKVELVIGYEKGTLPLRSRPCIIKSAEEVDKLVWNSFCSNNLAVYLPRFFQIQQHQKKGENQPPKVGIVAKGCDILSIVGLVKEKQIPRKNVVIIGVPCQGMIDVTKVEKELNGEKVSVCEDESNEMLQVVTMSGEKRKIKKEQVIADACNECKNPAPEGADFLVEGKCKEIGKEEYKSVDEFEAKSSQERWEYFEKEISKCIRCYACRQACPNCYCKVCFADQTKPRWIGPSNEMSDVMVYHIGRIFHQAGRCVGCDACVKACPMNIDLRTFTQKLVKDVKELFDFTPGLSLDELPPLCTFKDDDNQSFITEP